MNSIYCKNQFSLGDTGAIQQHFNIETAKNLLLIVPPVDEQKEIVSRLEDEIGKIDNAITKAEKQMSLANDYLPSLFFRVVTGQIAITA